MVDRTRTDRFREIWSLSILTRFWSPSRDFYSYYKQRIVLAEGTAGVNQMAQAEVNSTTVEQRGKTAVSKIISPAENLP